MAKPGVKNQKKTVAAKRTGSGATKRVISAKKTVTKNSKAPVSSTASSVVIRFVLKDQKWQNYAYDPKKFWNWIKEGPLELSDWANALHVGQRTLENRLNKGQALEGLEADRAMLIGQLIERGNEVFGDKAKMERWLDRPHMYFGNKKPKEFLDNTPNIGMVFSELDRIEAGSFA
jgi:putative toxin-antitoxin system antitoxin component (TIGR02293 family)